MALTVKFEAGVFRRSFLDVFPESNQIVSEDVLH